MRAVMEAVCAAWDLGELRRYAQLPAGTSAGVWRAEADRWVLIRTLPDAGQGEREYALNQYLLGRGFRRMPVIFSTAGGAPALCVDGVWYQVQSLIVGSMPDPARPGTAAAMARLLRELAAAMPEGMIHGDLGPWNMLQQEDGTLMVIDFGGMREGDRWFDAAAALGGVINHTPESVRAAVCGEFLAALEADRDCLLAQLRLWAQEGIARWNSVDRAMTARFYHALHWAEEHIYEL